MGPGFCVGVNGLLLGYAMYSTGLMPPRLAIFGVIDRVDAGANDRHAGAGERPR
mgnify:CR=1 FL=1